MQKEKIIKAIDTIESVVYDDNTSISQKKIFLMNNTQVINVLNNIFENNDISNDIVLEQYKEDFDTLKNYVYNNILSIEKENADAVKVKSVGIQKVVEEQNEIKEEKEVEETEEQNEIEEDTNIEENNNATENIEKEDTYMVIHNNKVILSNATIETAKHFINKRFTAYPESIKELIVIKNGEVVDCKIKIEL